MLSRRQRIDEERTIPLARYAEDGFSSRYDYLLDLADCYDHDVVFMLADLLGPEEDFDGLVVMLEDQFL